MAKVILDISISLDGYVAGPDQSAEHPLGVGGDRLHDWAIRQASWREEHGREGGERGIDDEVMAERTANVGATIMGRGMFGGGPGPWPEEPWNGWWGEEPPFRTPVFVLTNHSREEVVMRGGTTFTFVTDGVESACAQAIEAAGGKDVVMAGGANAGRQFLDAGLLDEMRLHVVPILLGSGARLLDGSDQSIELTIDRVVPSADVTHLYYRVG